MPTDADFRWQEPGADPFLPGFYEVTAADDRWGWETPVRYWCGESWWVPAPNGGFLFMHHRGELFWRGPHPEYDPPEVCPGRRREESEGWE